MGESGRAAADDARQLVDMDRRLNYSSPGRRTTAASVSGLTLSPLLGSALGDARMSARRSWSPQHQSSLEVPTPRQIQSARNSLAAVTGTGVRQQNSIEVLPSPALLFEFFIGSRRRRRRRHFELPSPCFDRLLVRAKSHVTHRLIVDDVASVVFFIHGTRKKKNTRQRDA